MEGFTKIPNTVFELGLTPSQFTVLCNLIRVQSYREHKGEVEDGWFAKSQNELTKECGFGCHKRLTRVLEGMVKMNIVQIRTTKTVTYFKIDIVNEDPTSSIGKQTVTLIDCNLDEAEIAKIDVEADFLDQTMNFTFSDVEIPDEFKELNS